MGMRPCSSALPRSNAPRIAPLSATVLVPGILMTTAGELDFRIPKLRQGSFFPSLLERRRRVDRALFAVVMEAYVHGVFTRILSRLSASTPGSASPRGRGS